jgi:PAS domain S-box-containing protein
VAVSQDRAKILLVDDSPENLVSLEATLLSLNQDLVLANSGREALRHLLQEDFAVILLDVKMPDMDGFETAELIRSRRRSRHTPILFLTAYKNDEHLFRGYDLGAVDFLFKPIIPEVLRSKVAVFVELNRNTSLLKKQAEVLGRAEQKFRSLLEAAPDAMAVIDHAGKISVVNAQLEKIFGYGRQDVLGRTMEMLVPFFRRQYEPDLNADSGKVGFCRRYPALDLNGVRKDGTEFPVEISVSPLETEEGTLVTAAIRDVTGQKKALREIRDLNSSLEQRVAERTAELMETIEALRQSNDDLNQFVYAASHDLQEPLRLVALYSQMLQRKQTTQLDEQASQYLEFVLNSALRMETLLKDLLEYSQVGALREGPPVVVSCGDVLQKVVMNLQASIEQSGAVITWGELPTVHAHEIRLVQLFQNLVGNAIKYRREDPPQIRVDANHRLTDWLFSVEDNGIGINSDYSQQIFGIFKRLHGNKYPGTGIGLAICQRIVESYGGRIWLESTLGAGSCFFFTLQHSGASEHRSNVPNGSK